MGTIQQVYMVIGGEVDVRSGAAAVPTRMTALEQTQIDPRILAQRNASGEPLITRSFLNRHSFLLN